MKKLFLSCMVALGLIGCGGSSKNAEISIFKAWQGSFKSVDMALEDKRMDETYNHIAKTKGKSKEEVRQAVLNLLSTKGYKKLSFHNDSITYVYKEENPFTIKYKSSGVSDNGKFFLFTWTNEVPHHAELKYIYTTKPHQDTNDSMVHFHFKFGKNGFDELKSSHSFPTFAKQNTPLLKMIEDYKASKDELAGFIK